MARSIRSATLETRAARLRLPVAIKPTFVRVAKGLGLGYRRNKSGGVWVMRVADGKRSSWVRTIGAADDFAEADGGDVLNFWQAQDKVRSLARADRGGTAEPITVAQALSGPILLPCCGSVLVHGVDPDFLIAPRPPRYRGSLSVATRYNGAR